MQKYCFFLSNPFLRKVLDFFSDYTLFYGFRSPILEETQHFLLVIALAFFQETRILNMNDFTFIVQHNKHWEAETRRVVKTLQHLLR